MKKEDIQLGGTYLAKITDKVVPVRLDAENKHGGWDATNLATNKKVRIKSAAKLRGPAPRSGDKEKARATAAADQENARLRDEREASPDGMTASERAMAESTPEVTITLFRNEVGKSWRWRNGNDVSPKHYMSKSQARFGALKAHPTATVVVGEPSDTPAGEAPAPTPTTEPKAPKAPRAPRQRTTGEKRVSLIDAAVEVLRDAGQPMNCKTIVEQVVAKGLWSSPNGKTPEATLYSAILREIKAKETSARFVKADRGHFTLAKGV